jgi:DNA-directed RNA polymerase specialized sigma24 family protein
MRRSQSRLEEAWDVEALGALYDRESAYAYRGALALLGDPALAAAAVEDAFLEVWRSGSPDELLAAVYRACVARRRGRPRLEGLPEGERAAISLARFGGMTVAETATFLGVTAEQVRLDLLQGLRRIASGDRLGPAEGVPAADRVADPREARPPLELKRQARRSPQNGADAALGDGEAPRDRAVV